MGTQILKRLVGDLERHNSKTYAAHKRSYPNLRKKRQIFIVSGGTWTL